VPDERIQRLERAFEALRLRVEALEEELRHRGKREAPRAELPLAPAEAEFAHAGASEQPKRSLLPLLGRTLLVLGGAFFLRAATDAGILPRTAGAALGLVYGLSFLPLAYRAANREGFVRSAHFHALSSALVVFPLLFEATVELKYLAPSLSAAALGVSVGAALFIAWRRGLHGMAWIFAGAGAPLALALAMLTKLWLPYLAIALAIYGCTLLFAYARKWLFLGISGAVLADMMVLLLTSLFLLASEGTPLRGMDVRILVLLQYALVGLYLGTFAQRTLVGGRAILPLEIVQTVFVLIVGMGGALVLARHHQHLRLFMGGTALLGAALSYAVSFSFIDRRRNRRSNFIFYTSIALVFMLVASFTLFAGELRSWILLADASLTAAFALQKQRTTLLLHAALFTGAAALSSGLLRLSLGALLGWESTLGNHHALPLAAVMLAAAACSSLRVAAFRGTWGPLARAPRTLCLALLVLGICGIGTLLGDAIFAGDATRAKDAAAVASLRTGLLAVVAVLLAWISRKPRFHEARWLVYPTLVLGGVELLLGDLRHGRSATMFLSLVIYGSALILAPRLLKKLGSKSPSPTIRSS